MKRVDVRLSIPAVAPLLDLIKSVADELRTELAVPIALAEADAELAAVWREDLLESQRDDCDRLFSLFNQEFFSEGVISFDRENAEAVLRACAALRLRFRKTHLAQISDDTLEALEASSNIGDWEPAEQKAFACFMFLDELQKIILKYLDPMSPEED
jgi:signal transduction histidine kinase